MHIGGHSQVVPGTACALSVKLFSAKVLQNAPVFGEKVAQKGGQIRKGTGAPESW